MTGRFEKIVRGHPSNRLYLASEESDEPMSYTCVMGSYYTKPLCYALVLLKERVQIKRTSIRHDISIRNNGIGRVCVIRTNKMYFFSLLIYFNNLPLHVSNRLTIHHQEVRSLLYLQHMVFIMYLL